MRLAEIRGALARLDGRLEHEVRRLRLRYQLSLDEFRGLYVSDEQVDALLDAGDAAPPPAPPPPAGGPALPRLAARFDLSPLAQDVLLLALAPDLDPKYAPVIAYLNDDVAARWPTFDLARRLFAGDPARDAELALALAPGGPLFGSHLIDTIERGGERRPVPLMAFAAAPSVADHVLGRPPRLAPGMRLFAAAEAPSDGAPALADLVPLLQSNTRPLVLLQGAWGSGREAAAAALAAELGRATLRVDLRALQAAGGNLTARLDDAVLFARLLDAVLLIAADRAEVDDSLVLLADAPVSVFVAVPDDGRWAAALKHARLAAISFPPLGPTQRRRLWSDALAREGLVADAEAVDMTAARFRLTPRRIVEAAAAARIAARVPRGQPATVAAPLLLSAARSHAALDLGALATPVAAEYGWSDLVLPPIALRQLRELADAIVNRDRVFRDWGFARTSAASGLAALFAGSSGTGKTMSATVIARETGLDLWRIDLSTVVSKYIGETEKHLERIFATARDGNAILFFDEADALFGSRSEVKDAHDRYANIEIAYLLQRLELHDGISILATNLAKNVDQAFSRRMHAVVEFPLPDAAARERLWRNAFPAAAPLAPDVDFPFLAKQFALAGGDIRVAALDAAFLAAAKNDAVTMTLLVQAVARQMLKQGKVPSATEFRQYYGLLGGRAQRMSIA